MIACVFISMAFASLVKTKLHTFLGNNVEGESLKASTDSKHESFNNCHEEGTYFGGESIHTSGAKEILTFKFCHEECVLTKECLYFRWSTADKKCELLKTRKKVEKKEGFVSGTKNCAGSGDTKYCSKVGHPRMIGEAVRKPTKVLTLDGCMDLCRKRSPSDCQFAFIKKDESDIMCHEFQEAPPTSREYDVSDPDVLSANRNCGKREDDYEAGMERNQEEPNYKGKMGVMVNILRKEQGLEDLLRQIGHHKGKHLVDTKKKDCYTVKSNENNEKYFKSTTHADMQSASQSVLNTIGASGGGGPVKLSLETSFGSTEESKRSMSLTIKEAFSYAKSIRIKENCLLGHRFPISVIERIQIRLEDLTKLKEPTNPSDMQEQNNYWDNFFAFANDFGTHMVVGVHTGIRVFSIQTHSSESEASGSTINVSGGVGVEIPTQGNADFKAGTGRKKKSESSKDKNTSVEVTLGTPPDFVLDWGNVMGSLNKVSKSTNPSTVVSEEIQSLWSLLQPLTGFEPYARVLKIFAFYVENIYPNRGKSVCTCAENLDSGSKANVCATKEKVTGSADQKVCAVKEPPLIKAPRPAELGCSSSSGDVDEFLPFVFLGNMCGDEDDHWSKEWRRQNKRKTGYYLSILACNDCTSPKNESEEDPKSTMKCLEAEEMDSIMRSQFGFRKKSCEGRKNYCENEQYRGAMNQCCRSTCGLCNREMLLLPNLNPMSAFADARNLRD